MWRTLRAWFSRLLPSGARRGSPATRARLLRARYDSAATNEDNRRHWGNTDSLSPASANTLAVRQVLRDRSRYETANNGYAAGIIRSRADDLVGVGPTLQVLTPDDDVNDQIKKKFTDWAWACGLAEKLHTLDMAEAQDGESFAILTTNDKLRDPVKLDIVPIECDLVTDPTFGSYLNEYIDDGITYDASGNPVSYTVLRYHPGDQRWGMAQIEYDVWPAEMVLHSYRCDRPGQLRGIPELTSSLPLFAYLRRWTLACLSAAETAASFAAVLQTPAPADGETDEPVPFDTLEIERGMLTTLPEGTTISQFAADHPPSTYSEVKRQIVAEAARPVQQPVNIAMGQTDSNFASAKMDHHGYRSAIKVRRCIRERNILDRIFLAWWEEAKLIPSHIPVVQEEELDWAWTWPGWPSMDKDQATLDTERLNNGTLTLAEQAAEEGRDWRERIRQRGKELKFAEQEGVPPPPGATPAASEMGGRGSAAPPFGKKPAVPEKEQPEPADANGHARNRLNGAFCPTGEGGGVDPTCSPTGGGGDSEKDAVREREDQDINDRDRREGEAITQRHYAEEHAVEKARAKEDAAIEKVRAKEDAARERTTERRERDDEAIQQRRDREDEKRDATREKEDERREAGREKEDARVLKDRDREDERREAGREKEDEATEAAREKEDTREIAEREKEDAVIEREREKEDAVIERERDKEDARIAAMPDGPEKDAAEEEANARREAEDEALQEKRDGEDADREAARDEKDAEDVAYRAEEDQARQAARDAEDKAVDERREKEDAERKATREKEDAEQKASREKEDAEREAAREKEDAEEEARRDKEDAEWAALEERRADEDDERQAARDREDEERQDRQQAEQDEREARYDAERQRLDELREKEDSPLTEAEKRQHAEEYEKYRRERVKSHSSRLHLNGNGKGGVPCQ